MSPLRAKEDASPEDIEVFYVFFSKVCVGGFPVVAYDVDRVGAL